MDDLRMSEPILTLRLRTKRDVVLARQRARQVAGLLGFDRSQQVQIAAAIFDLAAAFLHQKGRGVLRFHASGGTLRVCTEPVVLLRLERPLPAGVLDMAAADVAWAAGALDDLTPLNVYEEMVQLNCELLHALRELTAYRQPPVNDDALVRPAA
jgi:hypothetical protein